MQGYSGTSMAIRDAKSGLSGVVDRVEHEHERIVITRRGQPVAVLMSLEDVESMEETLDILGHRDEALAIWASMDDATRGDVESITEEEARRRWSARA